MSNIRYILFTGSMQPKNPMVATEDKIKEIVAAGFRQGKDFDIVSEKVLKDKLGRRGGGMMNMDEMTRPLGYKFGTKDGTLVGDREKDLKEWEEDAIDRLRKAMEREKYKKNILKNLPEIFDDPKKLEEFFKNSPPSSIGNNEVDEVIDTTGLFNDCVASNNPTFISPSLCKFSNDSSLKIIFFDLSKIVGSTNKP